MLVSVSCFIYIVCVFLKYKSIHLVIIKLNQNDIILFNLGSQNYPNDIGWNRDLHSKGKRCGSQKERERGKVEQTAVHFWQVIVMMIVRVLIGLEY